MGKDNFTMYTGDIDSQQSLVNAVKNTYIGMEAFHTKLRLFAETAQRNDIPEENLTDFLYENYKDEESKEYLVDGAILTCTGSRKEKVTINCKTYEDYSEQDESIGNEIDLSLYANKVLRRLVVTENPTSEVNGLKYATINDCAKEDNINYFGNCIWPPDNAEEIQEFESHTSLECKEGTCKYLMNLEEHWDNFEIGQSFLNFPDDDSVKKPGITMTSILFCKHGGFIYPITSGQIAQMDQMDQLYLVFTAKKGAKTSGTSNDGGPAAGEQDVMYNFSTYTSRDMITALSSPDYHLTHTYKDVYVDENNLVRISKVEGIKDITNDYYCVAMARGFATKAEETCTPPAQYNMNAGYKMQVQLEDSQNNVYKMDVIIVEVKGSDDPNDFYTHNNIVEFFVEDEPSENISVKRNVSFDKLLGGENLEIKRVYAYENGAIVEGNYNKGGQWEPRE